MRDEEISGEAVFGGMVLGFIIVFLAIWGVVYLMMEAGIGMTYIPEPTQGTVIEKGIFESPGSMLSGRGPDHYWLKLRRADVEAETGKEGWIEFWIVLGDTGYAEQLWYSVEVGDFCIEGAGHKNSRSRWTCEDVRPILERYLDDRFILVSLPSEVHHGST